MNTCSENSSEFAIEDYRRVQDLQMDDLVCGRSCSALHISPQEDADELCIILHLIILASAGLFERTNEGYMTTKLINPRHVDAYC